jgi:cysteine desulfurase
MVGKMEIPDSLTEMADSISISAHKFHGPKGVGALWVGSKTKFRSILHGGDQEFGLRPGTENLPGIVGMAIAAEQVCCQGYEDEMVFIRQERDLLERNLCHIPGIIFNCKDSARVCNTSSITFSKSKFSSEEMVFMLSSGGLHVSAGAACNSTKERYSQALLALGMSPQMADKTLRFSLSRHTSVSDIEFATNVIEERITPHCI